MSKIVQAKDLAYITPGVVEWGIERSGLSYTRLKQLIKGVTEEQIQSWTRGNAYPPFDKAIRLAEVLHIPFGYLFLPRPPARALPLPDFRTLPDTVRQEPSPNFTDLLNDVLLKQGWFRDYAIDHNAEELSFVASHNINGTHPVAGSITETLNLTNALRRKAHSWSEYLSVLSESVETVGILVMRSGVVGNDTRRKLFVKEFQGFAIADKIAPLIFINAQDFKTAQIFTLAHELAHIWVGRSGISNVDETGTIESPDIENFCNHVAAEILVPQVEFEAVWRRTIDLQRLARYFWVSTLVILRRAHELNKITRSQFFKLLEEERGKRRAVPASGGDYYRNVIARHGGMLTEAVIRDVREGGTPFRDAARILSLKVPTLVTLLKRSK